MPSPLAILKALAETNRLRLLAAVHGHGELCACQLTELLAVSGATCSRHLAILAGAGLLRRRREGRWMYFSAVPEGTLAGPARRVVEGALEMARQEPGYREDEKRLRRILAVTPSELCRGGHAAAAGRE